jgi:hypothetical protein
MLIYCGTYVCMAVIQYINTMGAWLYSRTVYSCREQSAGQILILSIHSGIRIRYINSIQILVYYGILSAFRIAPSLTPAH